MQNQQSQTRGAQRALELLREALAAAAGAPVSNAERPLRDAVLAARLEGWTLEEIGQHLGLGRDLGPTRGAVPAVELLEDAPQNAPTDVVSAGNGTFITFDTSALTTALAALRAAIVAFPATVRVVQSIDTAQAPTAASRRGLYAHLGRPIAEQRGR